MPQPFALSVDMAIQDPLFKDAVSLQMERILAHEQFQKAPRLAQLFRFLMETTIAGNAHTLKEYTIAVDVFNRPETFDCRLDSIVRVQAARLRKKLTLFHRTAKSDDKFLLTLPPSGYEPVLSMQERPLYALPVVALLGEENIGSTAWTRSVCQGHAKIVSFSRDSLQRFSGTMDLLIVLLAVDERHSDFGWVLEAIPPSTAALVFVPYVEKQRDSIALSGAIRALIGEKASNNISSRRLFWPNRTGYPTAEPETLNSTAYSHLAQ